MKLAVYKDEKMKSDRKCYFCGKKNPDTKDHIPPRGVFPKIPKGQLITVPAHKKCNSDFCKDDELFRNFIITESNRTLEGIKAWDKQVVESFKKNPGAKKDLRNRLKSVLVKFKSGAYICEEAVFAEKSLYDRQIIRITKGLFYHKFQEPLPADISIKVSKWDVPEVSLPYWNKFFAKNGFRPKLIHIVPDIFSYFYGTAKEDKYKGMAIMVFYNTVVLISFIG